MERTSEMLLLEHRCVGWWNLHTCYPQ